MKARTLSEVALVFRLLDHALPRVDPARAGGGPAGHDGPCRRRRELRVRGQQPPHGAPPDRPGGDDPVGHRRVHELTPTGRMLAEALRGSRPSDPLGNPDRQSGAERPDAP